MALAVIVFVKAVPDEQLEPHIDEDTLRLDRSISVISELDEYAIEAALRIKEAHEAAVDVITVTMGGETAGKAARKALQLGADKAIHVRDDALAGSDASITSKVLAATVNRIVREEETAEYLVVAGMASPDAGTGLIPAQVAARLRLRLFSHCSKMQVDGDAGKIRAVSRLQGVVRELQAKLPVVVSITEQMPAPRYPTFKNILAAKKKEVVAWGVRDIGLSAAEVGFRASPTKIMRVKQRRPRTSGILINTADEGVEAAAAQAIDFLLERGIVFGKTG